MSHDHFSTQSSDYVKYRPTYPEKLFDWLAAKAASTDTAWDCACGSGQATLYLATRFKQVVGSDLSRSQLNCAPHRPNIEWRVAHAEDSGLEGNSVDLITVAQALHWFDLRSFWQEVRRVGKYNGLIAVWSYGVFEIGNLEVKNVCNKFYDETVGPYWPPERKIVEAGYGSLDFPFQEIQSPSYKIEVSWNLDQLIGYFSSWSATTRYKVATGNDPLPALREQLAAYLGHERVDLHWPISLRVGRINS